MKGTERKKIITSRNELSKSTYKFFKGTNINRKRQYCGRLKLGLK